MKLTIISANLGRFDKYVPSVEQMGKPEFLDITDKEFSLRSQAMTPRLQAKIPKCFGYQFAPGSELCLWVDASFALLRVDSAEWIIQQLGGNDLAVFRHPNRKTVGEEWEYLQDRANTGYMLKRYAGELKGEWEDNAPLYAAGVFIYRNIPAVWYLMKEWWYLISRYHVNDQLSLSTAIKRSGCAISVIDEDIYNCPYFTYTRTREYLNG